MRSPHVVFVLNVILGLGGSNDQVVFREVDELGYTSWIGCGYEPPATTRGAVTVSRFRAERVAGTPHFTETET